MVTGNRVSHHAYGCGTVLDIEEIDSSRTIVQVMWDDPSLSTWPGEEPRKTFWTDLEDLDRKGGVK